MKDAGTLYLERYPDVASSPYYGTRPREHYDNHGKGEGRVWEEASSGGEGAGQSYLKRYPDVAASPYYKTRPREHYDNHGKSEGRIWEETKGPIKPPVKGLGRNRIIYIDDACLSLDRDAGGDPNGFQDNVNVMAMAVDDGNLPLAFGVSTVRNKIGVSTMQAQVDRSGLDIPVLAGSPSIPAKRSELSDFIVNESKKGSLKIAVGGTIGDVSRALKDGAHRHNMFVYATLGNTSNYKGDHDAGDYARNRLGGRLIEIDSDYRIHLGQENLRGFFSKYVSKVPVVSQIWKTWILDTNASYNKGRVGVANPWTISDCMNYFRAMGKPWRDYKSVKGSIERGLNKMSK